MKNSDMKNVPDFVSKKMKPPFGHNNAMYQLEDFIRILKDIYKCPNIECNCKILIKKYKEIHDKIFKK